MEINSISDVSPAKQLASQIRYYRDSRVLLEVTLRKLEERLAAEGLFVDDNGILKPKVSQPPPTETVTHIVKPPNAPELKPPTSGLIAPSGVQELGRDLEVTS